MSSTASGSSAPFLAGDGEMAALIRAHDWARTPLGPPETWRAPLKAMVRMALATHHPISIFWGPELICLYNDGYRASLGDERHPAILGMPARQSRPEDWPIVGPRIEFVLRGDGATWNENRRVPIVRHGARQDVHWTCSYGPIDDEQSPNGVGGVLAICAETTEHVGREAEQALRDSEERFRLAVQSSSLGTWDVDLAVGLIALSDRAQEQFDLDQSSVGFDDMMASVHPDDRDRVASAIAGARDPRGRGEYHLRHRVQRRDGSVRWLSATGRVTRLVRDDGRVQERFVGVLADITEQQQLLDVLREADRRKDEFLATLAHELRNPLAPIRTAAHMLSMNGLSAERLAWCSDMIRRQTATMALLLDDLLEVSRISSGRLELRWAAADVRAIVRAAVETAQPVIDAKRHALQVTLAEPLPDIHADALRVAQILTNLLTNAAKYTDQDGHLRLDVRVVADRVLFDVIDDGIGLEPDMLLAVFEMFHQVKGAHDRTQGGLGIGLSLSQGLAALHGGRVDAFSDGIGKGSTFRLTLPVNAGAASSGWNGSGGT